MKITITHDVKKCCDCPYFACGNGFDGMDGREGRRVFICEKGAFGERNAKSAYGFDEGLSVPPKGIHENCPLKK